MYGSSNLVTIRSTTTSNTYAMGKHHKKRLIAPKKSKNPFKIFEYDPLNHKPIDLPPDYMKTKKVKKTKTPKKKKTKIPETSTESPLESVNPFWKYAYQPSHK